MHYDSGAACGRGISGVGGDDQAPWVRRRAAGEVTEAVHVLYWQALFYYHNLLGETYAKGRALRWALPGSSIVCCTVRVDLEA